jgi:hypothetical protein
MSYWNSEGTYQAQYEELIKLVPREGEIKKGMCKHVFSLERFRKACNSYYDVFNNGGGNRDASTSRFFPGVLSEIRQSWKYGVSVNWDYVHRVCDEKMDEIIREAYVKNIGEIV